MIICTDSQHQMLILSFIVTRYCYRINNIFQLEFNSLKCFHRFYVTVYNKPCKC